MKLSSKKLVANGITFAALLSMHPVQAEEQTNDSSKQKSVSASHDAEKDQDLGKKILDIFGGDIDWEIFSTMTEITCDTGDC